MSDIFLSSKEEQIINHLASAWNVFMSLDGDYHDDEIVRFRAKIHDLQNQIMARPTRRFMKELEEHREESRKNSPILKAMKAVKENDSGTLKAAVSKYRSNLRKKELRAVLDPYITDFLIEVSHDKSAGARPFK